MYNLTVAPFTGAWIETPTASRTAVKKSVAPFTGAWIETSSKLSASVSVLVAPFTGAWIETLRPSCLLLASESHPSRVRGLKPGVADARIIRADVAPFTGAWIETIGTALNFPNSEVAPFTGAWIETTLPAG